MRKRLNFYIDEHKAKEIKRYCFERELTMTQFFEELLDDFLKRKDIDLPSNDYAIVNKMFYIDDLDLEEDLGTIIVAKQDMWLVANANISLYILRCLMEHKKMVRDLKVEPKGVLRTEYKKDDKDPAHNPTSLEIVTEEKEPTEYNKYNRLTKINFTDNPKLETDFTELLEKLEGKKK